MFVSQYSEYQAVVLQKLVGQLRQVDEVRYPLPVGRPLGFDDALCVLFGRGAGVVNTLGVGVARLLVDELDDDLSVERPFQEMVKLTPHEVGEYGYALPSPAALTVCKYL